MHIHELPLPSLGGSREAGGGSFVRDTRVIIVMIMIKNSFIVKGPNKRDGSFLVGSFGLAQHK